MSIDEKLSSMSDEIDRYLEDIQLKVNKKRDEISNVFGEIKKVLNERESALKLAVSEALQKEEKSMKKYKSQIKEHLKVIDTFRHEVKKVDKEKDIEILLAVKAREKLAEAASKRPVDLSFDLNLTDVKKENELAYLIKVVLPAKAAIAQSLIPPPSKKVEKYKLTGNLLESLQLFLIEEIQEKGQALGPHLMKEKGRTCLSLERAPQKHCKLEAQEMAEICLL